MGHDNIKTSLDPEVGPVSRYRYNPTTGTHERRHPNGKFIKGPIPLDWVSRANRLPGKAGAVGAALWFLVGLRGDYTVKLTGEVERIAGCTRKALYRALGSLEAAGLISIKRKAGSRATVTVLASGGTTKPREAAHPLAPPVPAPGGSA